MFTGSWTNIGASHAQNSFIFYRRMYKESWRKNQEMFELNFLLLFSEAETEAQ
jgi:hypothetical protein